MSSTYLTDGVVLARRDWREYDRLITLYTEKYGKVETVARGVRKITSKLAGNLEPMTYARFMLARGRTFDVVASSVKQSSFQIAQNDLGAFALASYFLEVLDRLTRPNLPDHELFALLVEYLDELERDVALHDGSPVFQRLLLTEFFLLRVLHQLGFLPALETCAAGRETLPHAELWFSFAHGGLVCDDHRGNDTGAQRIRPQVAEILRLMGDGELEPVRLIKRDDRSAADIGFLLNTFITHVAGEPMRSEQYFLSILAVPQRG